MLFPISDNLRIERLSRAQRPAERGKIIAVEILLREKPVNCRRRAKSRHAKLLEKFEMENRIKRPFSII
jgi:hypothetical protein